MSALNFLTNSKYRIRIFHRKPRYTHYCSVWNIILSSLYQKCTIWKNNLLFYLKNSIETESSILFSQKLYYKKKLQGVFEETKAAKLQTDFLNLRLKSQELREINKFFIKKLNWNTTWAHRLIRLPWKVIGNKTVMHSRHIQLNLKSKLNFHFSVQDLVVFEKKFTC